MKKRLTRPELIAILKKRQGKRPVREFARELGISHVYLMHIYNGRRDPGMTVLAKFGLQKDITYSPLPDVNKC